MCCEAYTKVLRTFTVYSSAFLSFLFPAQLHCEEHLNLHDSDKTGQVTNFAAVPSAEAAHQIGMLRGKKEKFSWFSGIFVPNLQCFGTNEAFSAQTIWAKGCLLVQSLGNIWLSPESSSCQKEEGAYYLWIFIEKLKCFQVPEIQR